MCFEALLTFCVKLQMATIFHDMVMLEQVQDVIGLPVEVVLKYVDNTG